MTEEENCTICGDDVNLHRKIILGCKHSFHYSCLIEALKSKLNLKGIMKPGERCCPYCRRRLPLIPYHEQCGAHIPGIHKSYPLVPGVVSDNPTPICSGVCKNGQQCKFKSKYNGYCGHHKLATN